MESNRGLLLSILIKTYSYIATLRYRIFYRDRVFFGRNFITNYKLNIKGSGKVVFGDNINAWSHKEQNNFITFSPEAQITIGDNCRVNGLSVQSKIKVDVGNNCILGSALLVDTDFHSTMPDRMTNPKAQVKSSPVSIGNNVWVCGQCVVLKGIKVGDNSILGFASVVVKDVPNNVLVGGNPAQIIKKIV